MATVPFTFECSKEAGFVMDPNAHTRFGYVTALKFAGVMFEKDLKVSVPFNTGAPPAALPGVEPTDAGAVLTARVVGVMETFAWNGGVSDPLELEFYVSHENATHMKSLQQRALPTTKVETLAWWIADYDQEAKMWFEQAYPIGGAVSGMAAGRENPAMDVDLNPVPVKDGIDVNVYKVTMNVVPAANVRYTLHFANSSTKKVTRPGASR